MKKLILTILFCSLLMSCRHNRECEKVAQKETVQTTKEVSQYSNFTDTRKITFMYVNNYQEKTISVSWFIWIDGDIVESNPDVYTRVKIEDLKKYKEERTNWANERIPYLLEVKETFKKIEANQ